MQPEISNIRYWKIVDLILQKDRRLKSALSLQVAIYHDRINNMFHACCVHYHLDWGWMTVSPSCSQDELDQYRYYHLRGTLDISDYDDVEERLEDVDKYVLAMSSDVVLSASGFWPEYNAAGNKQWHWMAPPEIRPADEAEVLDARLKQLLSGVHIVHDGTYLDMDNTLKLEGWR